MSEAKLLQAAVTGSETAYEELVEPHRRLLHAHCYGMLRSVHDAEDAVQETLLRAWRKLSSFQARSSLRSWLYTIATNVCLRMIERRARCVLPIDYGPPGNPHQPLGGSTWIEPSPDERLGVDDGLAGPEARYEQRESIELAFIAALQHLPARQRAVLILRDVLAFSGAEVADALHTTPASVHSALQRAHETVNHRLPDRSQQATLGALDDAQLQESVERYVQAWERHDIDAIVAMLIDSATIALPPTATWYRERDSIAAFLAARRLTPPTRTNGQLAARAHLWDPTAGSFQAPHTAVLTLHGELIDEINIFIDPWALTVARPNGEAAGAGRRPMDCGPAPISSQRREHERTQAHD